MATITLGIPGPGGDLYYSADARWASVFSIPLSRIDATTNELLRQWVGRGCDLSPLWAGFTLADGFSSRIRLAYPARCDAEPDSMSLIPARTAALALRSLVPSLSPYRASESGQTFHHGTIAQKLREILS